MKKMGAASSIIILAMATFFYIRKVPPRPRYIFINETENKSHDLALKTSLKIAEKNSGIENALIILKKLPPHSTIEQTAVDLFKRWDIGRKRKGQGILYLYSQTENVFKIEVSYGLEGTFPDGFCHRLEESARTYMLSDRPQDFLSELIITLNIHGHESLPQAQETLALPSWFAPEFLSGGAGVRSNGYRPTLSDYHKAVLKLNKTETNDYRPSSDPQECVEQYLKSLASGLGDPNIPLLTEGSQIFRMLVPRNEAQQLRIYSYFQKAFPYEIYTVGHMGVALFRPGVANLPIVLRRGINELWYVDEPKAWTYFHRFEDGVECFPKYDDLSLMPVLKQAKFPTADHPIYRHRTPTPAVIPYPFDLQKIISQLEIDIQNNPNNDVLFAKLGEIYLFEINWIAKSIEYFSQAAKLAPTRLDYRWRLYDLYINNSEVEKALEELRFIADNGSGDIEVAHWLKYYTAAYQIKKGEFF